MSTAVDFQQIQGLVRFGYGRLKECSFLLLTLRDAQAARDWLATAPISNAVALDAAPSTALQIAFTHAGLLRLGLAPDIVEQFSLEFRTGLALEPARSRLLGDVGASSPAQWAWGGSPAAPHVLMMLYAQPGKLASWQAELQTPEWASAFDVVRELKTSDLDGAEPFGFQDGLSQPALDWERSRIPATIEEDYTNQIALGEFLLGYPNEYNRYTDRPLLAATSPGATDLPEAEEQIGMRDFGKNGCYLVLRTLEQDVTTFNGFLAEHAGPDARDAELLASAMVGRRRDGTPLATWSTGSNPGLQANAQQTGLFTFDGDPKGTQCPFGAHIRRANPRNGDLPAPRTSGLRRMLAIVGIGPKTLHTDAKASSRFHRILRRGREYAIPAPLDQPDDKAPATDKCGIHFVCLVANIARQFEFLQSAWIMSTKFDGMTDESDPLLGSREPVPGTGPADIFSRPNPAGLCDKVDGLPRFVHVRGGAYFFLPSLQAMRYLAHTTNTRTG